MFHREKRRWIVVIDYPIPRSRYPFHFPGCLWRLTPPIVSRFFLLVCLCRKKMTADGTFYP